VTGDVPALERTVAEDEEGQRVDVVLAAWTGTPRAQVQQLITSGGVLVEGAPAAKSRRVQSGERIVVLERPSPVDDVEAPPPVPLRWEDDHLVVVSKPAGLVVHAGAGVRGGTLLDALRAMGVPLAAGPDPDRPGVVHRLDRGTSGLLVLAKTEEARAGLAAIFKAHGADRRYWALVDGSPDEAHATIDAPISRSRTHRTRFTVDPAGRRAVTSYDVVRSFGRAALLAVRLETGRTHQVRVHLSAIGHPVCGDRTYGASAALARELGLGRPALHAQRLAFAHPVTGERVEVEEPLPADLATALERLHGPAEVAR
jgi:23S rRNA pseudouridine1911/1915/1917 synthase